MDYARVVLPTLSKALLPSKSVDQLLNGTFEDVQDGVAYPEADAGKEATSSQYIQAYRTSVKKALRQADGPHKAAVIKAIRDEMQQIIGAIALARFESLSVEERKMSSLLICS